MISASRSQAFGNNLHLQKQFNNCLTRGNIFTVGRKSSMGSPVKADIEVEGLPKNISRKQAIIIPVPFLINIGQKSLFLKHSNSEKILKPMHGSPLYTGDTFYLSTDKDDMVTQNGISIPAGFLKASTSPEERYTQDLTCHLAPSIKPYQSEDLRDDSDDGDLD